MTLKKFIKYFDDMTKLHIVEFPYADSERGVTLFEGYVFDKGAKKTLKKLYKQNYKLERNIDGCAVMMFSEINEFGVTIIYAQVNVRK